MLFVAIALSAAAAYLAVGVLLALPFHLRWLRRIDPATQDGGAGFRLLITPGLIALWPVLLHRLRGHASRIDRPLSAAGLRRAHRRATAAAAIVLPVAFAAAVAGRPGAPPRDAPPTASAAFTIGDVPVALVRGTDSIDVRFLAPPPAPAIALYWRPAGSDGLTRARWLGAVPFEAPRELPLGPGFASVRDKEWVFYSLAHGEIVGTRPVED